MGDFDLETIQRITKLTERCRWAEDERDAYKAQYLSEQETRLTMQSEVNRIEAERDALEAYAMRLHDALSGVAPSVPPHDAPCHKGIVSQEKCRHCQSAIKAQAALSEIPVPYISRWGFSWS